MTSKPGVQLSKDVLLAAARQSGFQPDRVVLPRLVSEATPAMRSETTRRLVVRQLSDARIAFRSKRYQDALKLAREVSENLHLKLDSEGSDLEASREREAELHQFLSLVYFALANYDASANEARGALELGRHWNWTTLKSHYAKATQYSSHLRKLENSIREDSNPEKRFLVAYHYWVLGRPDSAKKQFERVAAAMPNDQVVALILREIEHKESNK